MEIVAPVAGSLGLILLMERTHAHRWTSLPGVTEGLGTGSVRPLFRARRFVPIGEARGWLLTSGFYGLVPAFVTYLLHLCNSNL